MKANYEKIIKSKYIETEHIIRIYKGTVCHQLKSLLENVPLKAELIDIEEITEGSSIYFEITFREKKEEKSE